jgi:quinoprotein glucose dehydrogenase
MFQCEENILRNTYTVVLAMIFAVFGVILVLGGGWLLTLGGSPYYVLAGIGFFATGVLLLSKRRAALAVYALTLGGTLIWAVWEIDFDWWQLAPRGGVPVLLGLLLLVPSVWNTLKSDTDPTKPARFPKALGGVVVASVAVAGYAMFQDPSAIEGALTQDVAAPMRTELNTGNETGDGEWRQYGRTGFGQRWSPLDQITPANVKDLVPAWQYQTGDVKRPDDVGETTYQATPIKIGDNLYVCTPHNIAISLNAKTGQEIWRFDANSGMNPDRQHQTCRGVRPPPPWRPRRPQRRLLYIPRYWQNVRAGSICRPLTHA